MLLLKHPYLFFGFYFNLFSNFSYPPKNKSIPSPGLIGILMLSELIVAAISANILLGEPMSSWQWLGAVLIVIAGLTVALLEGKETDTIKKGPIGPFLHYLFFFTEARHSKYPCCYLSTPEQHL